LVAELEAQGYQAKYIPWYIELIKRQTTEAPPGGWQFLA
jgi:hypothetical protein